MNLYDQAAENIYDIRKLSDELQKLTNRSEEILIGIEQRLHQIQRATFVGDVGKALERLEAIATLRRAQELRTFLGIDLPKAIDKAWKELP